MSLLHLFQRKKRSSSSSWERTPPAKPEAYLDEDGRRHRTDAPYLLPKDLQEVARLDYQHYLFRHVLKGNTFAPVDALLKQGANVLDVGCGTGRWGREMASTYPKTQVIGLDLENVPRPASMPLNYRFQRGNVLNRLPFAAQQFEYVHQRFLVAGIPTALWPSVVQELKRVTHPGGWVELVEMGTTFHHAGPATNQFLAWWASISATRGIDASKLSDIGSFLDRSGFSHIKAQTEILPVGDWGGASEICWRRIFWLVGPPYDRLLMPSYTWLLVSLMQSSDALKKNGIRCTPAMKSILPVGNVEGEE